MLLPGMFYFDNDRHATNAGAIGAFGFRMGMEISRVLATGTNWVTVPKSVRLTLKGTLRDRRLWRATWVFTLRACCTRAHSISILITACSNLRAISTSSISRRAPHCAVRRPRCALTACFFPPSEQILAFARERAQRPFTPVYADADAYYENDATLDISTLEPQVALPGGVHRAVDVSKIAGQPVDHAFIGSCGSGMYEDFLRPPPHSKNKHVAPDVRMFIAPGSEQSTKRLAAEGILNIFIEAGAISASRRLRPVQRRGGWAAAQRRSLDLDRGQQQWRALRRERRTALPWQPGNCSRVGARRQNRRRSRNKALDQIPQRLP